ncbi:cyclic nucleotide-binding domain-containing protein [Anaerospora hongkongensis]|uniref:cyclic nucleotide-binding domain-containing protein n=1 Tax=Anaerospora hongkongensis TaxID=244830 RepID=UPI0028A1A36A|nr:cyclic nucleotide-binding domain-containing protein [Anaerospora hongkongensis]
MKTDFEESININMVTTDTEKKEIYRFRYQIYIEEMSRPITKVDHVNKWLYDELDDWGILLSAKIGKKLIATARINIGTVHNFPQHEVDFLSLEAFQNCYIDDLDHKFALTTKIMIDPTQRSSQAFYLLLAKCYELCYQNDVHFMFGICNLHLIRLYEKLGTHRYGKNVFSIDYGLLTPIVLLIDDIQHLRKIRSPLFRIARKRNTINSQTAEWFQTRFLKNSAVINSQMITEEELWDVLCERLADHPTKAITLLSTLTIPEAKKFLHNCGSYVHCDAGNIITTQGDISYTYNVLISGRLKSLTYLQPLKEYHIAGCHFGANGLTEHVKHTEDIAAINSAEILALSGIAFQRFFHLYPEIAHKIVQNSKNPKKN